MLTIMIVLSCHKPSICLKKKNAVSANHSKGNSHITPSFFLSGPLYSLPLWLTPFLWELLIFVEFPRVTCPPLVPCHIPGHGRLQPRRALEPSCPFTWGEPRGARGWGGFGNRLLSLCVSVLFSRCWNASDPIYPDSAGGNLPRSINYSWLLIDSFPELGQLTRFTLICGLWIGWNYTSVNSAY